MANLPETATYDAGVIQLETTTPVEGGADGASNAPLKNLANRTTWLKAHVDDLESGATIPPPVAPLNSPGFTGSPTAPDVAAGDRSTKVANTNFVQTAANGLSSINVAGGTNVSLTAAQYGNRILVLTGLLTANIAVIFPALSGKWIVVNNTTGSFTVTCRTAAGTGIIVTQGKSRNLHGDATNIYDERTDFEAIAITGDATAKTQDAADSSTKIATTSFVQAAISAFVSALNLAAYAKLAVAQVWSAQQTPQSQTLTDGATVNWNVALGQVATLTTAASRTIAAPTNGVAGTSYRLIINTGGYSPSWNPIFKFPGSAPTGLTGKCVFDFHYDGTQYNSVGKSLAVA